MRKQIFILTILLSPIFGSYAQECDCPIIKIDSALIQYEAIEYSNCSKAIEFLDFRLKLKHDELATYKMEVKQNYAPEEILISKTSNMDTINMLFRWIASTMDNPPIYDNCTAIEDSYDQISITVFEGNQECISIYANHEDAYFPFSYAKLYGFVQQFLVKYREKECGEVFDTKPGN